jgi:hypothetical protein
MTWVLMVATLTHLTGAPYTAENPSYGWKAYVVQDAKGCRDKLAELRSPQVWHANCHDQAHSVITPLIAYGKDVR